MTEEEIGEFVPMWVHYNGTLITIYEAETDGIKLLPVEAKRLRDFLNKLEL